VLGNENGRNISFLIPQHFCGQLSVVSCSLSEERNNLPITNHQSPITNHQSPITNHQFAKVAYSFQQLYLKFNHPETGVV
jgi:hypothetical protein